MGNSSLRDESLELMSRVSMFGYILKSPGELLQYQCLTTTSSEFDLISQGYSLRKQVFEIFPGASTARFASSCIEGFRQAKGISGDCFRKLIFDNR